MERYISRLTRSLNHAIALSLKRDPHSPKSRFIREILLVKGIHFYGFHSSYSPFLKIYVADPACVKRAATIMQSGTVMSTRFHVFESHLSYILQFMCDFGLYGCGWIDLGDVLQRDSQGSNIEGIHDTLADANNPGFKPSPYFRQSRMPLELDALAPHILNRHNIAPRNLHDKLQIPAPPLQAQPLVLSVRELWEDERRRRVMYGLSPSPKLPIDPSDRSRGPGGDWVAESQWWEELRQKIQEDKHAEINLPTNSKEWEYWVMTIFESIEALWEEPWRVWKPPTSLNPSAMQTEQRSQNDLTGPHHSHWNDLEEILEEEQDPYAIDVDINMLSNQEDNRTQNDFEGDDWAELLADQDCHLEGNPADDFPQDQDFEEDTEPEIPDDSELALHTRYVRFSELMFMLINHCLSQPDPFQQDPTSLPLQESEYILPRSDPLPFEVSNKWS